MLTLELVVSSDTDLILSTFTLQQEVSPEGDDGHLFVPPLWVLREVHGEESTDCLTRQRSRILTEDPKEHCWGELNLDGEERKL